MEEKDFFFDIKEPTNAFIKHLNVPFNERIILSAPFGSGKTYFLREFFKKNKDKYETIHLFPVNYSVASNKDIFELIKYDILFELMGRAVDFDKVEFSRLDFLPFFIKENKKTVAKMLFPLLSFIPIVGKSISTLSDKLVDFYEEFEKQFQEVQIDDEKAAIQYLKSFTEQNGSIYEEDFYTQLICQLLIQLKDINGNDPKETVLIIDDLDRIDPEHIFRILNVLAAQMDKPTGDNKFDFDRIILVFDQQNVRNIFKNRYGTDVDFTGYIDKFYSYKIFEFSNSEGLQKDITKILSSIKSHGEEIYYGEGYRFKQGVAYVFKRLVQANVLTVRRLLKVWNQDMTFSNNLGVKRNLYFQFLILAELLLFIYEDWGEVLHSIKKITELASDENTNNHPYIRSIIEKSILLLDAKNHGFRESEEPYIYINEEYNFNLSYSLSNSRRLYSCNLKEKEDSKLDNPIILNILYLALVEIRDKKVIK